VQLLPNPSAAPGLASRDDRAAMSSTTTNLTPVLASQPSQCRL
jgi:hypothetical protein